MWPYPPEQRRLEGDTINKREIYEEYIKTALQREVVLDDRQRVVDMRAQTRPEGASGRRRDF